MKFTDLTVLLPCHSLEDFPVYHEGEAAGELLTAWCAPWHPALIHAAGALPTWQRVDTPPEGLSDRLLVIPPFTVDRLPSGYLARATSEGGYVVKEADCATAVAAALGALDGGAGQVDDELAADFLALGFCRLQMELLTRQMRYTTNLDETYFSDEALAAANAAMAGDITTAREHLQRCFDSLNDSRKHFYPVDVHLLDITLLAETTLGAALEAELARPTPTNLLVTGKLLRVLAETQPATWANLLTAIDEGRAYVIGGEDEERELPLLPIEAAVASLRAGSDTYEKLLGRRPTVYGRRRAGLWPALPQLLAKFAYQGALHFTLDDGRFPLAPQCKTRWEGVDTSVIDILARVPSDAAKPESFLSLSRTLSDSMDHDHVATVAFAHWPGVASSWYDVLRRVTRHSPVLGTFSLLDDYFMHTDMPGRLSKFEVDEYRTPYLKQAIIRRHSDPLSYFVREQQKQGTRTAWSALSTVRALITGTEGSPASQPETTEALDSALSDSLRGLASRLPRTTGDASSRVLVVNPTCYARRMGVELPELAAPPKVAGPVVAAGSSNGRNFAVVDVPALGFAWVEPAADATSSRDKPLAHENVLTNEFFEVKISRATGGIQAIHSFRQRGNQLSQQIAFRLGGGSSWSDPNAGATYTTMQADSVEITASCPAYGEIVSRGTLLDADGNAHGTFRQTTSIWAGSRLIHIDIELEQLDEPRADPWNSYYAARFAWPDKNAQLWRGVSHARQRTEAARLETSEFLDIDTISSTISILSGGLPYHRRSDERMVDTLLVVRGETSRRFSLTLGVDLPHPTATALELATPQINLLDVGPPPTTASGWFFHVGAKNVVATHWAPLHETLTDAEAGNARIIGFRARFLEIAGQAGRVPLATFRPAVSARQVDFLGETVLELFLGNDKIMLDFGAHELIEIEARWAT